MSKTQHGNRTGKFLAPGTRCGIAARNKMLSTPFLLDQMLKLGEKVSNLVELRNYSVDKGQLVQE